MLGPLDPFDFFLAKELGFKTVEDMNEYLTNEQYFKWMAYYVYKASMTDYEYRKVTDRGRQQS